MAEFGGVRVVGALLGTVRQRYGVYGDDQRSGMSRTSLLSVRRDGYIPGYFRQCSYRFLPFLTVLPPPPPFFFFAFFAFFAIFSLQEMGTED
jgi:hypothetical protein